MEWRETYKNLRRKSDQFALSGSMTVGLSFMFLFVPYVGVFVFVLFLIAGVYLFRESIRCDRLSKGILMVVDKERQQEFYPAVLIKEQQLVIGKPNYRPEISLSKAAHTMRNHLGEFNAHVLSIGSSQFKTDRGVWEFVVETDNGYYLIDIDNKNNVVKSEELTEREEFQKRMKPEYKTEDVDTN